MGQLENKISYSSAHCDYRSPLVSLFYDLVLSEETEILDVKDHRSYPWSGVVTKENVREVDRQGGRRALSTYASCWDIDLMFDVDTEKFTANITIYDGGSAHGERRGKRVTIRIAVDDKHLESGRLGEWIESEFKGEAEDLYAAFLEKQKEDWIAAYREGVIQSKKPTKSKQET